MGTLPWREFQSKSPLPENLQLEIVRLYTEKKDYLPGLSREEKGCATFEDQLRHLSNGRGQGKIRQCCHSFKVIQTICGRLELMRSLCWLALEIPTTTGHTNMAGFDGMGLSEKEEKEEEPYIFHFPPPNASVAHLQMCSLIWGSIPGCIQS